MSLTRLRMRIESKIANVRKEKIQVEFETEVYLANLLSLLDITIPTVGELNADKIEIESEKMVRNIRKYKSLEKEEEYFANLL